MLSVGSVTAAPPAISCAAAPPAASAQAEVAHPNLAMSHAPVRCWLERTESAAGVADADPTGCTNPN
jgi:hypothetical protein